MSRRCKRSPSEALQDEGLGYNIVNNEGHLEFMSNYQKKHKAFFRGIDLFSNQPSSTVTIKPYQYMRPSFSDIDVAIMDSSYNSFG